ncbi:alanine racemase [Polynucleobacter sp. IMCC30063]|uniref:alanine racemase n=1 Tax=unclassified Polynucleobacter TaxID=2640945 RepID=UPI001F44651E|nr:MULTISPECIES: alanine racemase [unclassified Polynucleobacter]MCE7506915.1 alanine racemase [Polynucleobacter sp. IMCC30063]MCE7527432.1 alanine racemase [Polynucleobacter sp. IMCC 30228]
MGRPILATMDTHALRHNLTRVRELAPQTWVWSVVKADAYGHGFAAAVQGLSLTDGFALLDLQDARHLREMGWQGPILLLEGVFSVADLRLAFTLDCTLVVHTESQVAALEAFDLTQHQAKPRPIYLKMNTGMNRLGFNTNDYRMMYHRLHAAGYHVHHMTHFANADRVDCLPSVGAQYDLFNETITGLAGDTSTANSGAILWHRTALGNWVRPGIMLYGASPTGRYADIAHAQLQPVMRLSSEIISIQTVKKGARIGYGGRYTAPENMRIGVIACGYADGYPRSAVDGTPVWVADADDTGKGVICPLAGQVSMDMLTIDLRAAPQAHIGSVVELWGHEVPVDEVAQKAGTIGYELLCALAPRVPVQVIR